jgi:hypothetical protein
MQFDAGLVGDAAAIARAHAELLARLPATVHAFIVLELQKWPTLFAASGATRPLLDSSPARGDLQQAAAGITRVERKPVATRSPAEIPAFQDEAGAPAQAQTSAGLAKEIDAFFQRLDPALEATSIRRTRRVGSSSRSAAA